MLKTNFIQFDSNAKVTKEGFAYKSVSSSFVDSSSLLNLSDIERTLVNSA